MSGIQSGEKIAFLSEEIGGWNGVGQGAISIVRALEASELPLSVVTPEIYDPTLKQQAERHVLDWTSPPVRVRLPERWDRSAARKTASWLKNGVLDRNREWRLSRIRPALTIVHSMGSQALWESVRPQLGGVPAIIVQESPHFFDNSTLKRNLEVALAALADYRFLIFVSARVRDKWLALDGLAGKTAFYLPNCCREDAVLAALQQDRAQVRERLGFTADGFHVVCVASVQARKGQDVLLDWMAPLTAAIPNLELHLVGSVVRGWGEQFREEVQASVWRERIHLYGRRDDPLDFIYAADALVLPSRSEAMPLVLLEAMALGTVIVASDVDGIPELIQDSEAGLLFSHDTPAVLVAALSAVAHDAELRKRLVASARESYWKNFSRAEHFKRYVAALETMLEMVGREGNL